MDEVPVVKEYPDVFPEESPLQGTFEIDDHTSSFAVIS
jgi:hypothetical protein